MTSFYIYRHYLRHITLLYRDPHFLSKKKIETHTSSRSTVHSLKLMSPVAEDKIEERKFGSTHRLCHFFGHYLQNLLLLIIYFHFYPDQNNVNEKWYYLATTNLTVFDNLSVPTVKLKAWMMWQSLHNDVTWSWWKGNLTKSNQVGLFLFFFFSFFLH